MYSLRWRLLLPIFALGVVMVILLVYAAASAASLESGTAPALAQLAGLILASAAAGVVITTFIVINWLIVRVNRITAAAEALTSGDMTARTGMPATDEISRMGYALDAYADAVQARQDELRVTLRRQRREIAHLNGVLEALHDGVIVQDLSGQVTLINETAKNLLALPGSVRSAVEDGNLEALTQAVTDTLGTAIAPGLVALGEPRRIDLNAETPDGARTVSVQAAAIVSLNNQRVGTVFVLRDVTDESRRERARETLLTRITDEIGAPLEVNAGEAVRSAAHGMAEFAREMQRHAVGLQKMLVEMRELTATNTRTITQTDRQLNLDKLVYTLINEWRSTANAANIALDAHIERSGLQVMGDERRLRWAVGNLIDNAIKYTPPGGKVVLEVKGEDRGMARLRIRDNGAGIAAEELPLVFNRFYRGNPITAAGRTIRVPGSGQGLSVAKEIIEAHGGMITIKSTPQVGTAVYFTLPIGEGSGAAPLDTASVRPALPADLDDRDETVKF
ncbi:MAG: ATP-binding protein [bacterium]|nr:ATP-binding protein [bacterium]